MDQFSLYNSAPAKTAGVLLCIKFRTMVPNAEELKASLAHLNELEWPDFKITDDPAHHPGGPSPAQN